MFVEIKVITASGRQKFTIDKSGILKCFLKSIPEKGKANNELIKILSKKLKIAQNEIKITSGITSHKKRLKINSNLDYNSFLFKVGICKNITGKE